jgi:hypothetical protein
MTTRSAADPGGCRAKHAKEDAGKGARQRILEGTLRHRHIRSEQITITEEKIRFLRPEFAIVDRFEELTGQLHPETGKGLAPRRVQLTFVLTSTPKGWRVAYYRAGDLRDSATLR